MIIHNQSFQLRVRQIISDLKMIGTILTAARSACLSFLSLNSTKWCNLLALYSIALSVTRLNQ